MIPVEDLFESHLTVADLHRSMTFFADVLGLELAHATSDGKAAFYWVGGRGRRDARSVGIAGHPRSSVSTWLSV